MKGTTLAYLLGAPAISRARYLILDSKFTSIENVENFAIEDLESESNALSNLHNGHDLSVTSRAGLAKSQIQEVDHQNSEDDDDISFFELSFKNILSGTITQRGNKLTFASDETEKAENLRNPCYIYFSEDIDINVDFAYFHDGYPLQVTPRHIFFWPGLGQHKFNVELDSNLSLDRSKVSVFCGDLSDILGEHSIEGERAHSIRLGSFPSEKPSPAAGETSLSHEGYFQLMRPVVNGDCKVQLHFPLNHAPTKFTFLDEYLQEFIHTKTDHNGRSYYFEGFGDIEEHRPGFLKSSNGVVKFLVEYENVESVAYSYNMVAEVMCKDKNGREVDQFELL